MREGLIKVFKAGSPDKPLYADQKQINANPDKLIKWDQRESWLAEQAKGGKKGAAKAEQAPEVEGDGATSEPAGTPARTKAELHALLDEKGIAYTQRMTVPQLEELLK